MNSPLPTASQYTNKFHQIPDIMFYAEELSGNDIRVYKVLLDYLRRIVHIKDAIRSKFNEPIVTVSQETIASKCFLSTKTVSKILKHLEELGLVIVEDRRGYKKNNHVIMIDTYFEKLQKSRIKPDVIDTDNEGITLLAEATPVEEAPSKIEGAEPEKAKPKKQRKTRVAKKKEPTEKPKKPTKRKKKEPTPAPEPEPTPEPTEKELKMKEYEAKLRDMNGLTVTEKEVIGISKHYNMLVCRFNNIAGYRSLTVNEPREHKNWKFFERVRNLCRENDWDANLYLEAQFDRAKKYFVNAKIKYPMPNGLCSEKSQLYFTRYLEDLHAKRLHVDRHKRVTTGKTKTMGEIFTEEIIRSTEFLHYYINDNGTELEQKQDKALRFYDSWMEYSPAYMYTVPWFRTYFEEIKEYDPENPYIQKYDGVFKLLDKSKKLQRLVQVAAEVVERERKIPANLTLEELGL